MVRIFVNVSARPTGLEPAIYSVTGNCVNQLHHGRIEPEQYTTLSPFSTTILQKMSQDVDARDERPDRVSDHEWDDILRIRVGQKTEGA